MKPIAMSSLVLLALGACATEPPTVQEAMTDCVDRALSARGPQAGATIGVNSKTGPSAGFSLGVSSDFLAGRTPDETFDLCVRQKTGQPPTMPLSLFIGS